MISSPIEIHYPQTWVIYITPHENTFFCSIRDTDFSNGTNFNIPTIYIFILNSQSYNQRYILYIYYEEGKSFLSLISNIKSTMTIRFHHQTWIFSFVFFFPVSFFGSFSFSFFFPFLLSTKRFQGIPIKTMAFSLENDGNPGTVSSTRRRVTYAFI